MKEIKLFNYEGSDVRVVSKNGEPWWVLSDVCNVLEIKNSRDIVRRLDEDEKGVGQIDTLGGKQNMTIVNEYGLYSVIFQSKKPSAKSFKRWVTHEVLPDIRKNGFYATEDAIKHFEEDPDFFIDLMIKYKENKERMKLLESENRVMKPKAEYFDGLVDRKTLTNFRDTTKEFNIPPMKFIGWLIDHKFIYRDVNGFLKPYADFTSGKREYFNIKEWKNDQKSGVQTLVTPYGREAIRLLLENDK